jgi:hypothetical protein
MQSIIRDLDKVDLCYCVPDFRLQIQKDLDGAESLLSKLKTGLSSESALPSSLKFKMMSQGPKSFAPRTLNFDHADKELSMKKAKSTMVETK